MGYFSIYYLIFRARGIRDRCLLWAVYNILKLVLPLLPIHTSGRFRSLGRPVSHIRAGRRIA